MFAFIVQDPTPVKAKQPPKAVTVEDSFKSCTSLTAVSHILQILAPDLLARLQEEFQVLIRHPSLSHAEQGLDLVMQAIRLLIKSIVGRGEAAQNIDIEVATQRQWLVS